MVVIGAGAVACALVDHLTRLGWGDVVVVEQGPLFETGGSTSHAPGLVFQTNPSKTMTSLARYTVERFGELRHDGESCFKSVGGIEVAATPERWEDLKRKHGLATSWSLESSLLTPEEAAEKIGILDPEKIYGAFYVPSDGIAKAVWAAEAMAAEARSRGARFYGETAVTGIEVSGGRVRAVNTSRGRIEADFVVTCAGIWGPLIGRMVGVPVPLSPMQHQYVRTTPLPELAGETEEVRHPIVRHQDAMLYFRQLRDRYGVGSYNHRPMPVSPDEIPSHAEAPVMPTMLPFTEEDFRQAWADACDLLPALRRMQFEEAMNGLFSFTPDGSPVLGESREVRGFWLAEAVWITHSAGVGKVVAEWMVEGVPSIDLRECDLHRFEGFALTPAYVKARASVAYDEVYDIIHPLQPMEDPRPLRVSPFYFREDGLGAFFLEASGWERPQWYETNAALLDGRTVPGRSGWNARYWSATVGGEHLVTRERVALYDMTSLKRARVSGPGALALLQRLTTGQLERPVGTIVYTLMLDQRGGIKSDITVARLDEDVFQLGLNGPWDVDWLRQNLPADGSVHVEDITDGTCCIGLWGPLARDVLQPLSEDDLSNDAFGYFQARDVRVREVPVTALRLSYVGELGWELYAPADYGLRLWDLLWQAGQQHGIIAGGRGAFNGLRLEKGYRLWGTDMWSEHDPYEAGLGFTVKLEKGDFIGREKLEARKAQDPGRRLSCLTLDDASAVVMGKEPVYANGRPAGFVTSAAYGYSIGKSIAYAWLPAEFAHEGNRVAIEYFGERYGATVSSDPAFDRSMSRIRG